MKCIKAVKATKNTEVGTIARLGDADAETKVKTGFLQYAPKSEWKTYTRPTETKGQKIVEL